MKFRLTAIRDKVDITKNEDMNSLRFEKHDVSDKGDLSGILDFQFSDNDKREYRNIDFDLFEDMETLAAEEISDHKPAKKEPATAKNITRSILNWVFTIFFAFFLAILINIYVCRPSRVSGESMVPTLIDEETVYISQLPYIFGNIKFGDIVVIDSNLEAKRTFFTSIAETLKYNLLTKDLFDYEVDVFWIKRVIGVEGDILEFKDDSIYRNGQKLYEKYLNTQEVYTYPNNTTVTVEAGHIFVMGDNRNVSHDSRHAGQIPVSNVVGKLVYH